METCSEHPHGSVVCDGLCDVKIPTVPPPEKRMSPAKWREWLREMDDLYGPKEVPSEMVAAYNEAVDKGGPWAGNAELKAILREGWSIDETARALHQGVTDIVQALFPSAKTATVLAIEQHLREGATSNTAVARVLCCSHDLVYRVSKALKEPTTVQNVGERAHHTTEEIDRALRLRASGLSYSSIGRALGISKGAAQGIIRRHTEPAQ